MSTRQSKTNSDTDLCTTDSVSVFDIEPVVEETAFHRIVNVFQPYIQPCVAELVGSTLFIFTGCMSVIENPQGTGSLQPALAHGLALSIVIALFGEIRYSHGWIFFFLSKVLQELILHDFSDSYLVLKIKINILMKTNLLHASSIHFYWYPQTVKYWPQHSVNLLEFKMNISYVH